LAASPVGPQMKLAFAFLLAFPCVSAHGGAALVARRRGKGTARTSRDANDQLAGASQGSTGHALATNDMQRWSAHEAVQAPEVSEEFGPFDPRGKAGRQKMLIILGVALVCMCAWAYASKYYLMHRSTEDKRTRTPKACSEDIYGFAVACMCYDLQKLAAGIGSSRLRISRVIASVLLVTCNLVLQAVVVAVVVMYVTPKWVWEIRGDYDKYEQQMYSETTLTVNGKHRGIPGHLQAENFATLDAHLKERVCSIPFSQPSFFLLLLFAWTLTCIAEMRQCTGLFETLIIVTPTIPSMATCIGPVSDEYETVVLGLTRGVKAYVFSMMIFPRVAITGLLLFLGSRFLAATCVFGDLLLNACALGFLLATKDLLYTAVVPDRNKREVENITLLPSTRREPASYWAFLGSFTWAFVAVAWTLCYVYAWQSVLPQYRWDVKPFCDPWLEQNWRRIDTTFRLPSGGRMRR